MANLRKKLADLIELTELTFVPLKPQGTLVAFVSFVINGWFYCGGVGLHSDIATRSYRLTYPTKKLKNGEAIPLFHPLNKAVADQIEAQVVAEWERLIGN